jgi:ABC-type Na+ efflux pump permease subunit
MAYYPRTRSSVWAGPSLLTMIYLMIGVVVAATHDYFRNVDTIREVVSAILAVVLWPLLFLDISLHVH